MTETESGTIVNANAQVKLSEKASTGNPNVNKADKNTGDSKIEITSPQQPGQSPDDKSAQEKRSTGQQRDHNLSPAATQRLQNSALPTRHPGTQAELCKENGPVSVGIAASPLTRRGAIKKTIVPGVPNDEFIKRQRFIPYTEDGSENEDYLKLYDEESTSETECEAQTFESIQLQLDIIKSLREQPWPMARKLQTLRLAKRYVQEHSVKLNRMDHLRESRIRFFRRMKRNFYNFIVFFIPWERRIKKIEGHFGAGIGSFFLFLRSLVWVNVILFTFISIFIVAPQMLSPSSATKLPEEERKSAWYLSSVLDAKGYLEYSCLFYGYYSNQNIAVGTVRYPLPLAYLVVFLGVYLFSIIIILRDIAHEQKLTRSSGQSDQFPFGWRVFPAWDCLITARETAENKIMSIATIIKEQILEAVEKGKKKNRKLLIFLRVCANILVLSVLSASGYLIFLVVQRSEDRKKRGQQATLLERYEISLAVTGLNAVCPAFFKAIGVMEQYHPRVGLHWELTRIMVMYLGNIYILVISLLNKINKSLQSQQAVRNSSESILNTTVVPTLQFPAANATQEDTCWETTVGQELFKLSVIDLVAVTVSVLVGELAVSLLVRFFNCCHIGSFSLEKIPGYPDFKLAENVLGLIYSQGLIWMGLVFSPGIIGLNLVKLVLIMYLRSWAVMVTNVPPKRIFKASHKFYLGLLLCMLFLCLLAVGYAIVELQPSKECGPFRGQTKMFTVITDAVDNAPGVVNTVFDYLSGPSVIVPLIIVLAIAIYYYRSKAGSLQKTNRDLLVQLHYERAEDRKRISKMAADKEKKKLRKKKISNKEALKRRHAPNPAFEKMVDEYEHRMHLERHQTPAVTFDPQGKDNAQARDELHGSNLSLRFPTGKSKPDEEMPLMTLQGENPEQTPLIASPLTKTRKHDKKQQEKMHNPQEKNTFESTSKQEYEQPVTYGQQQNLKKFGHARDRRRFQPQRKQVLECLDGSSDGEADRSNEATPPPRRPQIGSPQGRNEENKERKPLDSLPKIRLEGISMESLNSSLIPSRDKVGQEHYGVDNTARDYSTASGSETVTWGGSLGKLFDEQDQTAI